MAQSASLASATEVAVMPVAALAGVAVTSDGTDEECDGRQAADDDPTHDVSRFRPIGW